VHASPMPVRDHLTEASRSGRFNPVGARRFLFALLAAAALASCVSGAAVSAPQHVGATQPPRSILNLLQFNVREGATDGRWSAVAAVIKASGADVVTLDEVNVKSIFGQIAAATGFHAFWVPGNDGYSVGILSRFPIRRCLQYLQPPIRHAAYGCRIPIAGTNWWIFGAHLYCCDEAVRLQEAELLISEMKKHPGNPVVLAGDLNSQTPGENDPADGPTLVIPKLLSAGYIDSYRELYTLQQSPGFTIASPPYGQFHRRFDYVFHTPNARAVTAQVIGSIADFTWPSDHAALHVTLVNRPAKPAPR
jgi:endonuclease/exonuclease/phosphatase family metal-dependent hydrolase